LLQEANHTMVPPTIVIIINLFSKFISNRSLFAALMRPGGKGLMWN